MKIRSITYFCNPKYPLDGQAIRAAGEFLSAARAAYEAAGYEVQSTRLATVPFVRLLEPTGHPPKWSQLPQLARDLERMTLEAGIPHVSFGPALRELPLSYEVIPEALAATQSIFFGGVMADSTGGLDVAAVRACAKVMVRAAPLDKNGFANLRFAALANVPAGSPFFPAAYHDGDQPAFALALEAADLAVDAFTGAESIEDARSVLVAQIEKHGKELGRISMQGVQGAQFRGLDFSLAPFPDDRISLGTAFEQLGVPAIGLHGSLTAAAILTESIQRAEFPRTGFCGLMMPVLEDSTLAKRAADETLTVKDVLLYSAVCGTGLDTIPLPGNTTSEQIMPLLLDLCALALRLDKPLTARLMPIPGASVGEPTTFDFGYFANSRVMALDAEPLSAPLATDQVFELRKR